MPTPTLSTRVPKSHMAASEKIMHGTAEKFFDSRVRLATVCPETALMYAVLEDAFCCVQGQIKPQARRAQEWFFSDDSKSLFSFVSICAVLELPLKHIRKRLKRWVPTIGRGPRPVDNKSIGGSYERTRSG
jgi:hypothetical protein